MNQRNSSQEKSQYFSPPSPKNKSEQGQALVEFAFVLLFLLTAVFIIVETSRVLWAWNSVQNAARLASRYGITGQFEPVYQNASPSPRVASIKAVGQEELRGLKLNNNPNANFEDDYYYNVEVYGVNEAGYLLPDYAGAPGQPMVVRITYRVPIIIPILSAIKPSIPVFGQIVENNEQFGQVGTSSQGQGLPPPIASHSYRRCHPIPHTL